MFYRDELRLILKDSRIRYRLDWEKPTILKDTLEDETSAELSADLGLDLNYGEKCVLLETDSTGQIRMENFPLSRERMYAELAEIMEFIGPSIMVHLRFDENITSEEVFDLMKGMPFMSRLIVSPALSNYFLARIWPWEAADVLEDVLTGKALWEDQFPNRVTYDTPKLIRVPEGHIAFGIFEGGDPYRLVESYPKPVFDDSIPDVFMPGLKAIVEITESEDIFVNSQPVATRDALNRKVSRLLRRSSNNIVFIAVDETLPWNRVMDVVGFMEDEYSNPWQIIVPAEILE